MREDFPGPTPDPPKLLICGDDAGTLLCWNELTCAGTPENFCAAHILGDPSMGHLFKDAEFMGNCSATAPEYPLPKCGCDYGDGPLPPEDYCVHPEHSDTGDVPTTGQEPTIGQESTTGGSVGPTQWICTTHAQSKCVAYNYTVDPVSPDYKECWVHPELDDYSQPCVEAEDVDGAKAACKIECDKVLTNISGQIAAYNLNNEPDYAIVAPPIDCTFDDAPLGDEPEPLEAPWHCAPAYNALVAWGGLTDLRSVALTTALVTADGGSTAYAGMIGYIGFGISACAGGTCEVTIDALETLNGDIPGIFTDAAGAQTPYLLENVDLHLVQEVHGTLYQSRGTIVFPKEPFVGVATADQHILDSTPLGPWETTQMFTQASGTLSSAGKLTLNLNLNLAGGVLTIAIETID